MKTNRMLISCVAVLLAVAPAFAVTEVGLKDLLLRVDKQDAAAHTAFDTLTKAGVFAVEQPPAGVTPAGFTEEDLKSILFNLHKLDRKDLSDLYEVLKTKGVFDLKGSGLPADQDALLKKALGYIEAARQVRDQLAQERHDDRFTSWLNCGPNQWVVGKRREKDQYMGVAYECLMKLPASHPAVVRAWQAYQAVQ
jgi:hypothetical protein